MQPDKKKDALTDLVGVAGSLNDTVSSLPLKDGEAVTPSGEVVTMDFTKLARKLLDVVRKRKGGKK